MEAQVQRLVDKTWTKYHDLSPSQRLLIGIGGIPGSGKTTLATQVVQRLNERHAEQPPGQAQTSPIAAFVPMDGYHLTRAQLSAMADPVHAHARRGAVFTFDGEAFLVLVKSLREPLCPETGPIHAPSFSHAIKDPVANAIAIPASTRVVVLEGNYVCLSTAPWSVAASLMDERWFVEVDFAVAKRRLVARHVAAGIAADEEEAARRVDGNDLVNGAEIVRDRVALEEVVVSAEDGGWEREGGG